MTESKQRDADRVFLRTLTLLYVEDDDETREQMGQLLGRRVGSLLLARNGAEGLRLFREKSPDLILTDIQMPVQDGLAMAQEIRATGSRAPILVLTAFEDSDYFMRSIDIGVDKYVVKPVDLARLEAALLEAAHRLRADATLARRRQLEDDLRRHRAVGHLAGGMAHDYNNLLQGILGAVAMAHDLSVPGSEIESLLRSALASGAEVRVLGGALLLTTPSPIHLQAELSVVGLLAEAVSTAILGTAVTHDLVLKDEAGLWGRVLGDSRQLHEVFEQIASNAADAMSGDGRLTSTLSLQEITEGGELPLEPGDYLHVAMQDTGIGIRPEAIDSIFDPYVTTKPRGAVRGAGLGLTICRSIVQRHKGFMTAESEPGQGTTIHLYLPLAPSPAPCG